MKLKLIVSLVLIVVSLISVGCIKKVDNTQKDKVWGSVVNQEFSNFDVFAGSGLYFFEDNSFKYCTYKIYGSGVPVAFEHTSRVLIKQNGIMQIALPKPFETGYFEEDSSKNEAIYIELSFDDGLIKFGDLVYSIQGNTTVSNLSQYEIQHISKMMQKYRQGI